MEKIAKRIIARHKVRSVELIYAGERWHAKAMPNYSLAYSQMPEVLKARGLTSITLDEITALIDELSARPLVTASGQTASEAVMMLFEKLEG